MLYPQFSYQSSPVHLVSESRGGYHEQNRHTYRMTEIFVFYWILCVARAVLQRALKLTSFLFHGLLPESVKIFLPRTWKPKLKKIRPLIKKFMYKKKSMYKNHQFRSYCNIRCCVGQGANFAKGLSQQGEGFLPTSLPCLVSQ